MVCHYFYDYEREEVLRTTTTTTLDSQLLRQPHVLKDDISSSSCETKNKYWRLRKRLSVDPSATFYPLQGDFVPSNRNCSHSHHHHSHRRRPLHILLHLADQIHPLLQQGILSEVAPDVSFSNALSFLSYFVSGKSDTGRWHRESSRSAGRRTKKDEERLKLLHSRKVSCYRDECFLLQESLFDYKMDGDESEIWLNLDSVLDFILRRSPFLELNSSNSAVDSLKLIF